MGGKAGADADRRELDDTIIHCMPGSGASSGTVLEAGLLTLTTVRKDGLGSPASHLSIPGQLSAKDRTLRGKDMVFTGSPVQAFMDGAFTASIPFGCGSTVENP